MPSKGEMDLWERVEYPRAEQKSDESLLGRVQDSVDEGYWEAWNVAGKNCVELGCGTGLVSVLCAKLGARHVVATGLCVHFFVHICAQI